MHKGTLLHEESNMHEGSLLHKDTFAQNTFAWVEIKKKLLTWIFDNFFTIIYTSNPYLWSVFFLFFL